ncbi:alanine--glyoxylate aminotransferase family protein [Hasllibacter sp. MH4015]|uniref:pyridoxal-phosphate-dependent aminotransferase family protein n=1 Tax=Hasllibacter sp. MH4015 TaxID=2854029 RepID=UPI001CD1E331|nr:aminotransferase class V-fold PLP-dependent enzyme [Hasllibacter sp. MH4015]
MTLSNGRHYLAIPGPSVMPDRVLQAMHRPAPNIYRGELVDMVATIVPDLKAVARTRHHVAMYICNGHGVWEAALMNTFSRGDKVLALCTGRFGTGWGQMAADLGIEVEWLDFGYQSDVDTARVAEVLAADTAHRIKGILTVQVDTSTSVKNDIPGLRACLDEAGHPALLLSDNIACLGCDEFQMDDWGVDVMITGSQKGLMTPPGMGFVYFNDRADAARGRADLVTPYWDWRPRVDPDYFYRYFCGTAPTHHLYGLRVALDMLVHEEGVEAAWRRHAVLAEAIWTALEVWGQAGPTRPNVTEREKRSNAVTLVNFGPGNGLRLRDWMEHNYGVTLGIPLEGMENPDDYLRIGHMGHVNGQMVMGVLAGLQAGMSALQIPHGPTGMEAAMKVIAEAA